MKTVYIKKCADYQLAEIKKIIYDGLLKINFDLENFHNKKVGLKPNLLQPTPDEKAVITNSVFFHAVAQIVIENKGHPVVIESPAVLPLEKCIKKTVYADIIEKENIRLTDMSDASTFELTESSSLKKIDLIKEVFDVDILVNIPKFKTHSLTYITGAVKNLFGLIPGFAKSTMHMRLPSREQFNPFLIDYYNGILSIFQKKKKLLSIMDAITVLEGAGPGPSGTPRHVGAVLVSEDALAMDLVATKLCGLSLEDATMLKIGLERSTDISSAEDIKTVGDELSEIFDGELQAPFETRQSKILNAIVQSPLLKKIFVEKPIPLAKKCTLCYQCKKICPAGAINIAAKNKKVPLFDYDKCIRCMCCMEICPEGAIKAKKGLF